MAPDPYGWRAHLADDFNLDGHRLTIYKRRPDDTVDVVGPDGTGVTRLPAGADLSEVPCTLLPHGALEALRDLLGPPSSAAEVAALREALTLERRRVDDVLATVTG